MSERTPPPRVKVSRVLDRYCTRKAYSYIYTLYKRRWSGGARGKRTRLQKMDEDAKSGQLSECCCLVQDFVSILKRKKRDDTNLSALVLARLWPTGEDHFMGRVGRMRLSGLRS